MKSSEIRELSIEELEKNLRTSRADMLNLRMRKQAGQIEKTHELRLKRRAIARHETILSQKKKQADKAS